MLLSVPCEDCGRIRTYKQKSNVRKLCFRCSRKKLTKYPELVWLYSKFNWISRITGNQKRLCTKFKCPLCGKVRYVTRYDVITWYKRRGKIDKRCNRCIVKAQRGKDHPNWKGGCINIRGYRIILIPSTDKYAQSGYTRNGVGYTEIAEHRYIMAKYLKRNLKFDDDVHHINGNKSDNRIKNLKLLSKSAHAKLHKLG